MKCRSQQVKKEQTHYQCLGLQPRVKYTITLSLLKEVQMDLWRNCASLSIHWTIRALRYPVTMTVYCPGMSNRCKLGIEIKYMLCGY